WLVRADPCEDPARVMSRRRCEQHLQPGGEYRGDVASGACARQRVRYAAQSRQTLLGLVDAEHEGDLARPGERGEDGRGGAGKGLAGQQLRIVTAEKHLLPCGGLQVLAPHDSGETRGGGLDELACGR